MPKRYASFARLLRELYQQINDLSASDKVEVLPDDRLGISTGLKRNALFQKAKGKYVCCVDDDDVVFPYYIKELLLALESEPDAVAMNGFMTWDGRRHEKFFISKDLPYEAVTRFDGTIVYARFHNHLSTIKKEIALTVPFPDAYTGEDYFYALGIHNSGLIKTEVAIGTTFADWMNHSNHKEIDKPMYYYDYKTKK